MFWVDVVYSFQNDFFFLLVFEDLDSFCMFVWSFFSSIRQSPVVGLDGIKWHFIYLKTAAILTEEWGFFLPCCLMPHPATPPPLPQPAKARAAAVQVLGDSDKTNFSYQQTIVSNSLKQAWMFSTPFRSGWYRTTKLDSSVVCLEQEEEKGSRWLAF